MYMPNKPNKYGFKLWCMSGVSGFTYGFIIAGKMFFFYEISYYTQKNFFTTLSIIQGNFNYKIKYSKDYLVNKLILYQFEDIVTILRILFHQIDIKFSCIQEKPTSTLFYGYNFSVCKHDKNS